MAFHLGLLAIYAAWARGGSAPAFFWAIPWLALWALEMLFLLPPQYNGQGYTTAMQRLKRNLLRDPVLYVGLTLIAFLTLQWFNAPRELVYNSAKALWEYGDPPWPGLPFSIVRAESVQPLIWAIGVVAIMLGVRHGMRQESRRWLLRLLVYNGALLAVVGLLQQALGTNKVLWIKQIDTFFFATFGYPNHASAYFTLLVALNLGLLFEALGSNDEEKLSSNWLIVALVPNILGVAFAQGRAGFLLTAVILIIALIYGACYLHQRLTPATRVRLGILIGGVAIFLIFILVLVPKNPIMAEIKTIELTKLHKQLQGDRAELAEAALEIWGDYPWAGTGGWGFRRFVALYMGPEKWNYLKAAGRANVHNDAIQYLCEHGAIGLTLIIGLIFIPIGHLWFRLLRVTRVPDVDRIGYRTWFMSVSPVVWFGLIGTSATVLHSIIDLPFRSMAIIALWFIILASLPGFVPQRDKSKKQTIER